MKSPFTDSLEVKNPVSDNATPRDMEIEGPFTADDKSDVPIVQQFNPWQPDTIKIGDVVFKVAPLLTEVSDEYREPIPSGNPLVIVDATNKNKNVSSNFLVSEFAKSDLGGSRRWEYIRIDPLLVDNLQRLRYFTGKKIEIIDGYYSPGHLRKFLKLSDTVTALKNPLYVKDSHLQGRGVKINIEGFDKNVKQIAIAAIIACDYDIAVGVGLATMTLYVKPFINKESGAPPEDAQRITSYITGNEVLKVNTANFCINFKNLVSSAVSSKYGYAMRKATGDMIYNILAKFFNPTIKDIPWPDDLGDVISLMSAECKDPEVLIYALAYSPLGGLARALGPNLTVKAGLVDTLAYYFASEWDKDNRTNPLSLLWMREHDSGKFAELCKQRYRATPPLNEPPLVVPRRFFDWKNNSADADFYNGIKRVLQTMQDTFTNAPQQLPEGGTHHNLIISKPNPDKPKHDFTGKYRSDYNDKSNPPIAYGANLIINQAGYYISGKLGEIIWGEIKSYHKFTNPGENIRDIRDSFYEFYGKMDDNGVVWCDLYPQKSIVIMKNDYDDDLQFTILDTSKTPNKPVYKKIFTARSRKPSVSSIMLKSFTAGYPDLKDLLVILAWDSPLKNQLTSFFNSFKYDDKKVMSAIQEYYGETGDTPFVTKMNRSKLLSELDTATNGYLKMPLMFSPFAAYYMRFFYSSQRSWTFDGRPPLSKLDWIKKMLVDFREAYKETGEAKNYELLYQKFGVNTSSPPFTYRYKLKMTITGIGAIGIARNSGTIEITDETDYSTHPADDPYKWPSAKKTFNNSIVLWSGKVSLNPFKWAVQLSTTTIEGEVESSVGYRDDDFSGAFVQITQGSAFELPVDLTKNTSVSTGWGGVVILVEGGGKGKLEFTDTEKPSFPDSGEHEESLKEDEGEDPAVLKFLPSISMYRGEIGKSTSKTDLSTDPLEKDFGADYQITDTRYFQHDDATLSASAIEAIGRLSAEELLSFSDPHAEIKVFGHTDASGSEKYNKALSEARATNVLQAIKDRIGKRYAIPANKETVLGFGEDIPNKFGEFTNKNAWFRKVIVIVNGRTLLSLNNL